jgi:hypothetical protein
MKNLFRFNERAQGTLSLPFSNPFFWNKICHEVIGMEIHEMKQALENTAGKLADIRRSL